ncbi:hypothetical protein AMAG_19155 [Allomyces macrogynus ATCC 38327]|uniref:Uncharacterized protein n=1 Tax=Allomyces macrogynus (strain ATCC 38327) TaxID=578462 RepID=A0A0L0SPQ9_ALLM3|nr:hypothetical protein AMAG_19155 [Allomyces macrogynus ATCC 38327]|eukprot:KNE64370.1 hypothetical protein AMAG_19155 [Allomyces macrogynus ATCC 38327]
MAAHLVVFCVDARGMGPFLNLFFFFFFLASLVSAHSRAWIDRFSPVSPCAMWFAAKSQQMVRFHRTLPIFAGPANTTKPALGCAMGSVLMFARTYFATPPPRFASWYP